jgi:hypothetical protein
MIHALRRVLRMPGWIAAVWLGQLALAAAVGSLVAAAVDAALAGHGTVADGRILYALADLGLDRPSLPATAIVASLMGGLAGAFAWMLLVGGVIARIADAGGPARAWWRAMPAVIVQSLWHAVLRALLLFVAMTSASALPAAAGWPLLLVAWVLGVVALDVARARVVLERAAPWSPKTAALALVDSVRAPRRYAGAWALALLSTLLPLGMAYVALASLGATAAPTFVRGLSLVAILVGFWRLALVVDAEPEFDAASS